MATFAQILPMALNISHALGLIEDYHKKNNSDRNPRPLYAPRDYIMSMGGKRMRSLFCLMGYALYDDRIEKGLPLAYTIELFHNFTLVHDDIMDEAELRRGKPSVHVKFDTNAAILTGDVMLIEVYERLINLDTDKVSDILKTFTQTAREVCEGQAMDMDFEERSDVSITEYLKMIELKTAVLLGAALSLGALMGGATKKDHDHLYKFAVNAGIAFQLQDDYLDVYGDPSKFGKKVGGDIIQGKKTYLYLRALELMTEKDRAAFAEFYSSVSGDQADKVKRVTNVFNELYLPHYCTEAKEAFFDLANSHLEMVSADETEKEELRSFARKLMDRQS